MLRRWAPPVGVVFNSLSQGAQFAAHAFLPAFTLSLILAFSSSAVALWNHTLRSLTAIESTLINNTMLIQIAVLAWVFLGDAPTAPEVSEGVVEDVAANVVEVDVDPSRTLLSELFDDNVRH